MNRNFNIEDYLSFPVEPSEDVKDSINEICHHGIKGMKWGVRRYQNKDGSLTAAGRRRLLKMEKKQIKGERKKAEEAVKLERFKKEVIEKGDIASLQKNIDKFTNEDIANFDSRYKAVKRANDIQNQVKREKVDAVIEGVKRASDVFDTYQRAAKIVNNVAGKEVLPAFNLEAAKTKQKELQKKERAKKLAAMTPDQVLENYKNLTTDELKDLDTRYLNLKNIKNNNDPSIYSKPKEPPKNMLIDFSDKLSVHDIKNVKVPEKTWSKMMNLDSTYTTKTTTKYTIKDDWLNMPVSYTYSLGNKDPVKVSANKPKGIPLDPWEKMMYMTSNPSYGVKKVNYKISEDLLNSAFDKNEPIKVKVRKKSK